MGGYMIKIEDFNYLKSSMISYGGHSGSKKGVLIEGEKWLLKYPKSTKSMNDVNISYTMTPLSEYLGSHIYDIIGLDVHKTKLGIFDSKLVVACKDFLSDDEVIYDYNAIRNEYDSNIERQLEKISSSSARL